MFLQSFRNANCLLYLSKSLVCLTASELIWSVLSDLQPRPSLSLYFTDSDPCFCIHFSHLNQVFLDLCHQSHPFASGESVQMLHLRRLQMRRHALVSSILRLPWPFAWCQWMVSYECQGELATMQRIKVAKIDVLSATLFSRILRTS